MRAHYDFSKMKGRKNPYVKQLKVSTKLTKEEKDLLDSYERGEWRSVKKLKNEMKRYQAIAKVTLKKR